MFAFMLREEARARPQTVTSDEVGRDFSLNYMNLPEVTGITPLRSCEVRVAGEHLIYSQSIRVLVHKTCAFSSLTQKHRCRWLIIYGTWSQPDPGISGNVQRGLKNDTFISWSTLSRLGSLRIKRRFNASSRKALTRSRFRQQILKAAQRLILNKP